MGSPQAQSLSQDRIAREALLRNARFRQYHAKLTVVPGDFDVDDFGVARAQAAQFMAYGAGIVWIVEPLLALMIRRSEATPAGIPAGDPRIGPGSKCNAVRQLLSSHLVAFVQLNTGLSKSSASNPIGAEKRHTAKTGAAPRARGG